MFDPELGRRLPELHRRRRRDVRRLLDHLHTRDTTFAYVSRAPIEKIEDYKARKGWTFPWYSSFGSDFNYDFHVTLDDGGRAGRVQLPHAGRAGGDGPGLEATGPSSSPA